MADIGNTTIGASTTGWETFVLGVPVTMTEGGDFTSVSAHISDGVANAHDFVAAIYDNSGNLLASSSQRSDVGTSASWVSFSLSYSASDTEQLIIAIMSGGGDGNCTIYYDAGSAGDSKLDGPYVGDPPSLPDPASFGDDSRQWSLYGTYTPTGAASVGRGPFAGALGFPLAGPLG